MRNILEKWFVVIVLVCVLGVHEFIWGAAASINAQLESGEISMEDANEMWAQSVATFGQCIEGPAPEMCFGEFLDPDEFRGGLIKAIVRVDQGAFDPANPPFPPVPTIQEDFNLLQQPFYNSFVVDDPPPVAFLNAAGDQIVEVFVQIDAEGQVPPGRRTVFGIEFPDPLVPINSDAYSGRIEIQEFAVFDDEEDMEFRFSPGANGGVDVTIPGDPTSLTYVGEEPPFAIDLETVFTPTLRVIPATGEVSIEAGVGVVEIVGYGIQSASGALDTEAWISLDDQEDLAAEPELGWTEANPSSQRLTELNVSGSLTVNPGEPIDVGNPFQVAGSQDLSFQIVAKAPNGALVLLDSRVVYGAPPPPTALNCATLPLLVADGLILGDLDGNGSVAFADFLALSANFGQDGDYSDGDIDCNGAVAFADFLVLSANFGMDGGLVAPMAPATAAAVPEPSTLFLIAVLLLWSIPIRSTIRANR